MILLALALIPGVLLAETRGFVIFDGTLYENKPDLSSSGVQPIRIVYGNELWRVDQDKSKVPDLLKIRDAVRRIEPDISVGVIDIEHWVLMEPDGKTNLVNREKLSRVLAEFKSLAPKLHWGYYGIPRPDYWRAINGQGKIEAPLWMAENDLAQPVVDAQGAVFPSLYTFYKDQEGWVKYAVAQLKEARRLAGNNKPVYAFLWPQYHDPSPQIGGDYLSPDYWKLELDTVRQYADGIVIWGGYKQAWNDRAEWWRITKDFMAGLKSQKAGAQ